MKCPNCNSEKISTESLIVPITPLTDAFEKRKRCLDCDSIFDVVCPGYDVEVIDNVAFRYTKR